MSSPLNIGTSGTDDCPGDKRQKIDSDLKSFEIALELIKAGDSDKLKEMLVKSEISDINMLDSDDYTLLMRASIANQIDCVKVLLDHGAHTDRYYSEEDYEDGKVNYGDLSALYLACEEGHLDVVKILVAHHADANRRGYVNRPLWIACYKGYLEIAKLLIKRTAELEGDEHETSALKEAAYGGHAKLVEYLLGKGAHMESYDKYNQHALLQACESGSIATVDVLLKHGADINMHEYGCEAEDRTCLHIACDNSDTKMVEFLLSKGADVNAENRMGQPPLTIAFNKQAKGCVYKLLEYGADPNIRLVNYESVEALSLAHTPLMSAAAEGDIELMKALIKFKANVNARFEGPFEVSVFTPIIVACEYGHMDALQLLLENGAEVNSLDGAGHTPLMHLLSKGRWSPAQPDLSSDMLTSLKLLLEHGVDLSAVDDKGETVFDYVQDRPDLLQILKQHELKRVLK